MTNHATVESLRPAPVPLDPTWSAETLARILADAPSTTVPVQRPRRRRAALLGLAIALPSAAGIGATAAPALIRSSFSEVFSHWLDQGVDPAGAQRMATAPGPEGTVFAVVSAADEDGEQSCRTSILESPKSAADPVPTSFEGISDHWCSSVADESTYEFGLDSVSVVDDTAAFTVTAGRAVRAEARTSDGREYPALLVDGNFWGWYPKWDSPTLVAYASDGSVVGRVVLHGVGPVRSEPEQEQTPEPQSSGAHSSR